VTFEAPTVSNGNNSSKATCSPASGSLFAVGNTTVACTSTITTGASCSFTVTVQQAPRLAYTKFLAFGDSITAGTVSTPLDSLPPSLLRTLSLMTPKERDAFIAQRLITDNPNTYAAQLQQRLSAQYLQQSFTVDNDGFGGKFAADEFLRFSGSVSANNPQVVLLMEGTNDMSNGSGPDAAFTALSAMVQLALGQGRKICLATIPPIRPNGPSGKPERNEAAPRVAPFNDRIRALAAARGVPLVDVYNAMKDDVAHLIGADDLHPTPQGYVVITNTFFSTIKTAFETPVTGPTPK
jgi:lysophospholipase L1-like esterase